MASTEQSGTSLPGRAVASLRTSKLLWLAVILSVAGGGLWVYSTATKPTPATGGSDTPGMGFVQSTDGDTQVNASPRMVDRAASWMVRLGPSFIAGFLIGWGLRRFIKWTLILAVVAGVGLYLLNRSGVFDVDYEDVRGKVGEGVDWARANAGQARDWAMRYLPSSGAAIVGGFFGFRR